jgi:hypothetical protein
MAARRAGAAADEGGRDGAGRENREDRLGDARLRRRFCLKSDTSHRPRVHLFNTAPCTNLMYASEAGVNAPS